MTAKPTPGYFPLLDGLRAVAVAGVLLSHFSPTVASQVDVGGLGVQLFFVLSGFLITGLLLDARGRIDEGTGSIRAEWKLFLVRRTLRIFPLYYGVLVLGFIFNVEHVRIAAPWLFTYSYNFRIWLAGGWPDRLLAHFWSLAVEEQFYLLWPWLVLCTPRRALPWVMLGFLPVALAFRFACNLGEFGPPLGQVVLLPACWDLLAAGGLMALARHRGWTASPSAGKLLKIVFIVGLCGLALGIWLHADKIGPSPIGRLRYTFDALCFAVLIHACANDRIPMLRWILGCPVLVYLGRISYGIYVFHNFMHYYGPGLSRRLIGIRYFSHEWEHVAWLSSCTLAAAALSYHFYERPWLNLKRRWSLPAPGAIAVPMPAPSRKVST